MSIEFDDNPEAQSDETKQEAEIPEDLWIKSPTERWRACEVSEVLEDGQKWKIHYKGFSSKHDEIVTANSDRLTTIKPENVVAKGDGKETKKKKKVNPIIMDNERRLWCESNSDPNVHRECVIVKEKEDQYKVHFISYHPKYDIWLEKNSSRLSS